MNNIHRRFAAVYRTRWHLGLCKNDVICSPAINLTTGCHSDRTILLIAHQRESVIWFHDSTFMILCGHIVYFFKLLFALKTYVLDTGRDGGRRKELQHKLLPWVERKKIPTFMWSTPSLILIITLISRINSFNNHLLLWLPHGFDKDWLGFSCVCLTMWDI